ncbi:fungal-specific transcription factor domain-containing protein [Hypoxylon sp. FL1857]|nr:fungal-specific transcription factor domain-containing protein [Hypoxylon sp. FL1857]
MASPPGEPSARTPLSRTACILCRSRKVKCDKSPSGCLSCQQLGVRCPGYSKPNLSSDQTGDDGTVDNIFRAAGIERRKNGACQECRNTKNKCNQARPQCQRCQMKSIPCIYTGKHKSVRNAVRSNTDDTRMDEDMSPRYQEAPSSSSATIPVLSDQQLVDDFSWLCTPILPKGRLLRAVIESYFAHVYPLRTLGFLHKPTFLRAIDNERASSEFGEPLLYIICALGARFMGTNHARSHLSSQVPDGIPGALWGQQARNLIQGICCTPSFQNLMAMVLYCEYGVRTGDNAFVFMLSGCCYRMSRLLRLDVEPHATYPITSPTDITTQESQRRLLWSCYILDSFIGSGVESNLCWLRHTPIIPLPCKDSNFTNRLWTPPVYLEIDQEHGPGTATEVDLRGQITRIAYMRTQILRYIRTSPESGGDVPLWVQGSQFLKLLSKLETWHQNLPQFLIYKDINIYIHRDQGSLAPFYFLHLAYHACVSDLTRITLAGYNFPLAAGLTHAPPDFKAQYQKMCFDHAKSISQLLRDGIKYGTESLDDYFTATAAFESTKIQVVFLATLTRGDHNIYNQVVDNLRTNLEVLMLTHPYLDMPNVYLSALCPFLTHFGFSELAREWEPLQNTGPLFSITSMHPTPELGDSQGHTEVVGPMEVSYLNQIATFRLARSEVARHKATRPQTREPYFHGRLADNSANRQAIRHDNEALLHSINEHTLQSGEIINIARNNAISNDPSDPIEMSQSHFVPPTESNLALPLDEAEYLRMADEISGYMTWNGWLELPMEDYPII